VSKLARAWSWPLTVS